MLPLLGRPRDPARGHAAGSLVVAAASLAVGLTVAAPRAGADPIEKTAKKLIAYEGEVQQMSSTIRRPKIRQGNKGQAARRLMDAQVAFGIGNYDDAAVMLYDFVARYPKHRSYGEALYYLGESLFQKGDQLAARTYFVRLIKELGSSNKFYQHSLERLIELSLLLQDDSDVQDWLAALDRVPEAKRRSSVYYVRGKYAYFNDQYDDAIGYFAKLTSKSSYYLQSRYFLGVCHVAKNDLRAAIRVYDKLLKAKAKTDDDRVVLELAHLAIGRLFYECGSARQCGVSLSEEEKKKVRKKYQRAKLSKRQLAERIESAREDKLWAKAIDHYLMISRRSKFFDEALYEIAWVYVKNKKFEKALRAVELLAITDPNSARLPDVKILEGQLRTRKGKRLAYSNEGNAADEYGKAFKVFDKTRNAFRRPHDELKRLLDESVDPRLYMSQVTGRVSKVFEVQSSMPEVAASWVRKQPEVTRVVAIETDLGDVQEEIEKAEKTIARLEQALTASAGVHIFPTLSQKRTRAIEILEDLMRIRIDMADQLRKQVSGRASAEEKRELDSQTATRKRLMKEFHSLPDAAVAYGERIELARKEFDDLDKKASEVAMVVGATEASLVALEKYILDSRSRGKLPGNIKMIEETMSALRNEVNEMDKELSAIRHQVTLAKDAAGTGDAVATRARTLRDKLRQAISDEIRAMQLVVPRMSGSSKTSANQIISLAQRANSITLELDSTNKLIAEVVDLALAEVRESVNEEKARLSAYKREYQEYQGESQVLGGEVLGESFKAVRKDFYEILVQSDVGIIDITWAQREFADETAKRLTFDKKRSMRTLRADFGDIIDEEAKAKRAKEEAAKNAAKGDQDQEPEGAEGGGQ